MTMNLAMINPLSTSVPAAQPAARAGIPANPAKNSPSFARVLEDSQADQHDLDPASDDQADSGSIDAAGGNALSDVASAGLMAQPGDPSPIAPGPDAMATAVDQGLTAVLALISGAGPTASQPVLTSGASAKAAPTASMSAAIPGVPTNAATRIFAPIGLPQTVPEGASPTSMAGGATTGAGKAAANQDVTALMASLRASFGKAAPASTPPAAPDGANPADDAATAKEDVAALMAGLRASVAKTAPTSVEPATPDGTNPATPVATANEDVTALVANLRTSFPRTAPASATGTAAPNATDSGESAPSASEYAALPIAQAPTPSGEPSLGPLVMAIEVSAVDAKAMPATAPAVPALPPSPAPLPGTKSLPNASRASAPDDKSDAPAIKHAHTDGTSATIDIAALPDTNTAAAEGASSAASATAQAPAASPSSDAGSPVAAGPTHAEQSIARHLDLARDNQWLDQLAQDITQAATTNSRLKFQLNPEHLGSLQVEIVNSAAGTSVRMTADNDVARAIIADAQPQLMAEVRAQGLRIAESHVDLGSQAGSGSNAGGQHQSSEDHKPFVRTQAAMRTEAADSARPADDELYA